MRPQKVREKLQRRDSADCCVSAHIAGLDGIWVEVTVAKKSAHGMESPASRSDTKHACL